jgi:hypothetical protein
MRKMQSNEMRKSRELKMIVKVLRAIYTCDGQLRSKFFTTIMI